MEGMVAHNVWYNCLHYPSVPWPGEHKSTADGDVDVGEVSWHVTDTSTLRDGLLCELT